MGGPIPGRVLHRPGLVGPRLDPLVWLAYQYASPSCTNLFIEPYHTPRLSIPTLIYDIRGTFIHNASLLLPHLTHPYLSYLSEAKQLQELETTTTDMLRLPKTQHCWGCYTIEDVVVLKPRSPHWAIEACGQRVTTTSKHQVSKTTMNNQAHGQPQTTKIKIASNTKYSACPRPQMQSILKNKILI